MKRIMKKGQMDRQIDGWIEGRKGIYVATEEENSSHNWGT